MVARFAIGSRGDSARARLLAVHDDYRRLLGDLPPPGAEAIKRAFDTYFGSAASFGIYTVTLPADALRRKSGEFEATGGWDVKYRFDTEDGIERLDCFMSNRKTNDRLYRVYADGRVEVIGSSTDGMLQDEDEAFYADVPAALVNQDDHDGSSPRSNWAVSHTISRTLVMLK